MRKSGNKLQSRWMRLPMASAVVPKTLSTPFGRIRVGKLLGQGGFGCVYHATIEPLQRGFAIKFLDPHPFNSDRSAAKERFTREATVLESLRHPHIISFVGSGEHDDKAFILMEYFHGMTFDKVRERGGPKNPESTLPVMKTIAGALAFAHSRNIVHRDLKPTNMMAAKAKEANECDVRILDFGVAAIMDPNAERLTRTGGTFVGDAFSAPELSERPRLIDPRCDIFSFGATWFWLLTGRSPKGINTQAALRSLVKVPTDFERVVLRCLDEPEQRYQSMEDVYKDISSLMTGAPIQPAADAFTDDMALVLGIISEGQPLNGHGPSEYEIEQRTLPRMNKFRMAQAIRRLQRQGLITTEHIDEGYGGGYTAITLTDLGIAFADTHHNRILTLLEPEPQPRAGVPADDDIPF